MSLFLIFFIKVIHLCPQVGRQGQERVFTQFIIIIIIIGYFLDLKFILTALNSSAGPEVLYSVIHRPKDFRRTETSKEETNGEAGGGRHLQVSGRTFYGMMLPGMRAVSPSCITQRQVCYIKTNKKFYMNFL